MRGRVLLQAGWLAAAALAVGLFLSTAGAAPTSHPSAVTVTTKSVRIVEGQRGEVVFGRVRSDAPACVRRRLVTGRITGQFANAPLGRLRTDARGRWHAPRFLTRIPRPATIRVVVRRTGLGHGRLCLAAAASLQLEGHVGNEYE